MLILVDYGDTTPLIYLAYFVLHKQKVWQKSQKGLRELVRCIVLNNINIEVIIWS